MLTGQGQLEHMCYRGIMSIAGLYICDVPIVGIFYKASKCPKFKGLFRDYLDVSSGQKVLTLTISLNHYVKQFEAKSWRIAYDVITGLEAKMQYSSSLSGHIC